MIERARGPIEIPLLEPWQVGSLVGTSIVLLALLAWGIFRLIRAQKRRNSPAPPHITALEALDTAAQLAADDDEYFAVRSSSALRDYFEHGLQISSNGKTSEEFLNSLQSHAALSPEARAQLTDFLTQCDQVKFARRAISQNERTALTKNAQNLIIELHNNTQSTPTENQSPKTKEPSHT